MTDDTQLHETIGPQPTRRGVLKAGAGAGAAALVGPVATRNTEAIPPLVAAGLVAAGAIGVTGATVGWTLRDAELLGSDDPAEGLTPDVLTTQTIDMARKRKSNNRSTFIDNENILGTGLEHATYAEGKIAAIEAINDEQTESEVLDAATQAVDVHESTVKGNFLKSWNESANEVVNARDTVQNHSEVNYTDVFTYPGTSRDGLSPIAEQTNTLTLPDGTDLTVKRLRQEHDMSGSTATVDSRWSPIEKQEYGSDTSKVSTAYSVGVGSGPDVEWLKFSQWNAIWSKMDTTFQTVRDGLSTWVTNVYGEVQAGDLDTEELLTPRELAEMTTDDEQFNQAVADLMALNIPVDLEREAELSLSAVDGTIQGQLATTSAVTISAGDTVTPSSDDVDYYFTYDVSEGYGAWTAYNSGVDGGILTFTSEPYPKTLYQIETSGGETAEVHADDFSHDDSNDVWTVDLSGQLEDAITSVKSITYYAAVEQTQYETVQLRQTFTVESITNSDGEDVDQIETSPGSEPQDDTNYITEEEWQEMQDRQEELIDKYENAGGAGIIGNLDSGAIGGVLVLVATGLGINAFLN